MVLSSYSEKSSSTRKIETLAEQKAGIVLEMKIILEVSHICGVEKVLEQGEAIDGNWKPTYQYAQVDSKSNYQEPTPKLGFRSLVSIKGPLPKGLDLNKSWKKFLKQENL